MMGFGICVVGVGLMIGLSSNDLNSNSFKAEIAYFLAGLLFFSAGLMIKGKNK